MRRREVLAVLGTAMIPASPRAARGQPSQPAIGFLSGASAAEWRFLVDAFHQGLRKAGFTEGRNVRVEYRWADGSYDRLPVLAADLVARRMTRSRPSSLRYLPLAHASLPRA
jgi:putative tryptophan/tyrosine transport system substrate-binding protein